jgi:diguanylate cyclase (GGDEF)-like protein
MRRLNLTGKFALLSAVTIAALGVFLARMVHEEVQDRALADATRSAELIARLGVQPMISPVDLERGLQDREIEQLDLALYGPVSSGQVAHIKIWNRDGVIVYSDQRDLIGRRFSTSGDLGEAMDGELVAEISDLDEYEDAGPSTDTRFLEVYVPLRWTDGATTVGTFELYLPYEPIAQAISSQVRGLTLALLGGLLLLYAVLFRIVAGASRTLRRQARENAYLAYHDPLTDLPNRSLFGERVHEAIEAARRGGRGLAVMIMDLDRFREINDTLGHHTGDRLLAEIGPRLRRALNDGEVISRLGGDEFGVLVPGAGTPREAAHAARQILGALEEPISINGLSLDVEASVGIAQFPDHGADADVLLQRADVAMYVAKDARSGYELYRPERDRYSAERLALLTDLRRAIAQDELVVHYQPKAELDTGRVVAVEALVRWQHPHLGLLSPDRFVPLAEPTGLIGPLTSVVLKRALADCRAWRAEGFDLGVSVNLSVRSLQDPAFPDEVAGLLERWGVPPDRLLLEVTETELMADPTRVADVIGRLTAAGVALSIDDFGVGHSSLAYLKRLPVTELKIDRTFVFGMDVERSDEAIVRSAIELGRSLGLRVVAEGVEHQRVWARLQALGCNLAQGFYLSRPLPADDLTVWLRHRLEMGTGVARGAPAVASA